MPDLMPTSTVHTSIATARDSEARFEAVFEASLDAIAVIGDGVHRFVNGAYVALFGFATSSQLIGESFWSVIAPAQREMIRGRLVGPRCGDGAVPQIESHGLRRDGSEFDIEISLSTYRSDHGSFTVAVIRDVSERRRRDHAERRLRHERDLLLDQLQLQLTRMPVPCVMNDAAFRFTYWNPAAERLFGWKAEDVVGRHPDETIVPPAGREQVQALFRRLAAGDMTANGIGENVTRDGRAITCEWINTPLRRGDGSFMGIMSMALDLTDRLVLEDQLRQAQKMEAIGRLAGGVAHDFNNLLTVITGYGQMHLRSLTIDDPRRRQVEAMLQASERAGALTGQLLAFSRRQVLAPQVVGLDALVAGFEPILRRLIREDIAMSFAPGAPEARISVDPRQFEQVLMNLAVNARDAMPHGGTLKIATRVRSVAGPEASSLGGVCAGEWVELSVSDSGIGMDRETQRRLFEPFFSTKEEGKGTGLGLATVYGIVKQSGGTISARSAVGQGSTFTILMPPVSDAVTLIASDGSSSRITLQRGTVLLAEDDVDVRIYARTVLIQAGFTVIEATNGATAIALATGRTIDLLITDLIMPGIGGRELAARLGASRPELPVLYVTGYTDHSDPPFAIGALIDQLNKPFTGRALVAAASRLLSLRS